MASSIGDRGGEATGQRRVKLWERFGTDASAVETDRSAVIRDFVRWLVREPGARLPKRPTKSEDASP
jgi:hypothetical protein